MPESLGRYLRRERQMRDVSLEQIARETKISIAILEALENDRFEALPSPAILKGFLRAYANVVGLSENSLVLRYESILEERGLSPRGPGSIRQRLPRKPRRLARIVWLLLVVLGLGVGLRLLDRGVRPPPDEVAGAGGPDEVVYRKNYLRELSTGAPPGSPARFTAAGPEEAAPAGEGIHLLMRSLSPLTIRLVLDGGEAETIALDPGQAVARHAFRGALVETSHPEALVLEANGRPVGAALTGGRAARILLTPAGGGPADEPADASGVVLPDIASRVLPLTEEGEGLIQPPGMVSPD